MEPQWKSVLWVHVMPKIISYQKPEDIEMRWRCQNYCWNRGGGSPCQWHLVLFILYWTNHKLLCCIVCRICEVLTALCMPQNGGGQAQNDGGQAQNDGGQHKMTGDTVWSTIYKYRRVKYNCYLLDNCLVRINGNWVNCHNTA